MVVSVARAGVASKLNAVLLTNLAYSRVIKPLKRQSPLLLSRFLSQFSAWPILSAIFFGTKRNRVRDFVCSGGSTSGVLICRNCGCQRKIRGGTWSRDVGVGQNGARSRGKRATCFPFECLRAASNWNSWLERRNSRFVSFPGERAHWLLSRKRFFEIRFAKARFVPNTAIAAKSMFIMVRAVFEFLF